MESLKLIYFEGCPKSLPAIELLKSLDLKFEIIIQDDLDREHPLGGYSSPTLLKGDQIVFGSRAQGGGCTISLPSTKELSKLLL